MVSSPPHDAGTHPGYCLPINEHVGPGLFRDEDFAELYCPDNGRPSVPPSLLALALLLQTHDPVCCPAGRATSHGTWVGVRASRSEPQVRVKRFALPPELCRACPRYAECVADKRGRGPFITLHPEEERLPAARAFECTDHFRQQYRQRMVVEHRIARLLQLGMRKSRFVGRTKARFSTVAGRHRGQCNPDGQCPELTQLCCVVFGLLAPPGTASDGY